MMASLLGVSFEAMVFDNETLAYATRVIRGVEVTTETLAYEDIENAVFGQGHFLGGAHTMATMKRDYSYPELADRSSPDIWKKYGCARGLGRPRLCSININRLTLILLSTQKFALSILSG